MPEQTEPKITSALPSRKPPLEPDVICAARQCASSFVGQRLENIGTVGHVPAVEAGRERDAQDPARGHHADVEDLVAGRRLRTLDEPARAVSARPGRRHIAPARAGGECLGPDRANGVATAAQPASDLVRALLARGGVLDGADERGLLLGAPDVRALI
jgi:hypothetical protein